MMEVNGYRVFYIDQSQNPKKVMEIIDNTTAIKIALVVASKQPLFSKKGYLDQIKQLVLNSKKEIVIVNPDLEISKIVNQAGLPIYSDLEALEKNIPVINTAAAEEDHQEGERGNLLRIIGIMGIVIILVLAWVYFVYPTVTVEITPAVEYVRENITATGSLDRSKIDWDNNILPLHKFEVTLTDEDIVRTTGEKYTGNTYASGTVKFINENNEEVKIPAGTIVATEDDIKFETIKEVIIPPLKADYLMDVQVGTKAGQKEVEVRAVKKGSSGNVETGEITFLEKNPENIYVINPEPITGGRDKKLSIVVDNDFERLRENIEEKIKSKIINKVYQELGGNYRIISDQISYSEIDYNYHNQQGEVSRELAGTGTIAAQGYLIRNSELDRLTTKIFKDKMDANYSLLSSGVNIEELKLEENSEGLYNIKVELVAPVTANIKVSDLTKELAGKTINYAANYLQERNYIADFKIKTRSKNLPKLGFAIKMVVSEPQAIKVFNLEN